MNHVCMIHKEGEAGWAELSCKALYIFSSFFPCTGGGWLATAVMIVRLTFARGITFDLSDWTFIVVSNMFFIPDPVNPEVKQIGAYWANLNLLLTWLAISCWVVAS